MWTPLVLLALTTLGRASWQSTAAHEPRVAMMARSDATVQPALRILPLGASITFGLHSSNGDGYRQDLRNLLAPAEVAFIGSQCSGSMADGNSEGHSGYVISQMQPFVSANAPLDPNVVLLYVGTNDMVYPIDPSGAPARMAALVSDISSSIPGSLIVVGNLFLDTNPAVQSRIEAFNAALPGVLAPLQASGANVVIADMASALTADDLFTDGEHPSDVGYDKMAQVFYTAIEAAQGSGKIPPVNENAPQESKICNGPAPALNNVPHASSSAPGSSPSKTASVPLSLSSFPKTLTSMSSSSTTLPALSASPTVLGGSASTTSNSGSSANAHTPTATKTAISLLAAFISMAVGCDFIIPLI